MRNVNTRAWLGWLVGAVLFGSVAGAEQLAFRSFSLEHGLAQSQVRAVAQDSLGRLWLGTEGGGVGIFDGQRFTNLTTSDGLASDIVLDAVVDPKGRVWLAHYEGGLTVWDGRGFEVIGEAEGLPGEAVWDLEVDSRGRILATVRRHGVVRVSDDGLEWLGEPELFAGLNIGAVIEDHTGRIWVGAGDHQVIVLGSDGAERWSLGGEGIAAQVYALAEDESGGIWAGTAGRGLWFFDGHSFQQVTPFTQSAEARISDLRVEQDGSLWVASEGQGLWLREAGGRWRKFLDSNGLCSNDVFSILRGREGDLWLGTGGGGGCQLRSLAFTAVRRSDGLPDDRVWDILEASDGSLWFGTDGGGVGVLEGGTITSLTTSDGLQSNRICTLLEDQQGRIWMGSLLGGVNLLSGDKISTLDLGGQLRGIHRLLQARDGRIWISSSRGVGVWSNGLKQVIGEDDGLGLQNINIVHEDSAGQFWIATEGGLSRLADGSVRTWRQGESGLAHDSVTCVVETNGGETWIGTYGGGIARVIDPTGEPTFEVFDRRHGLADDAVLLMLADDSYLWVGTNRGLDRIDLRSVDADDLLVRHYGSVEGFLGLECNQNATLKDSEGRLWFGTVAGAYAYDAQHDVDPPPPPIVTLGGVRLVFEQFDVGPFTEQVDPFTGQPTALRLPWRSNHLTFDYLGVSLRSSDEVRYRFRLDGFDQDWSPPTSDRRATYSNLAPGSYRFDVQATVDNETWNAATTGLTVVITPPFWQTVWFRLVAVLLSLCVLAGIYGLRVRAIKAKNRLLEELVAARTAELAEKKDQLERINQIVRSINTETDLAPLLATMLNEMVQVVPQVEGATAFVWDGETERFSVLAAVGCWDVATLAGAQLTVSEANQRYVDPATEVVTNAFVIHNVPPPPASLNHLRAPSSMLALKVVVESETLAFLVLDSFSDAGVFTDHDLGLLKNLQQHFVSALSKAKMLDHLQGLNLKKNELLGVAAHDLRSPLSTIAGWSEVTIRDIDRGKIEPATIKKNLKRVVGVANRMLRLVSELLDYSAIESGRLSLELHEVELAGLMDETTQLYAALAERKDIVLEVEVPSGLPPVWADRERLLEVMDNLLSNAIKYTEPGGKVRVSCEALNGEVVTHIADTGLGLTEEDLKVVFRAYGRLSARPTGGEPSSGLGLAIVRKIVEEHGGRVWVKSAGSTGSTFSFALPIAG